MGDKARTAKDRSLDSTCRTLLQKICQKYDNLNEVDKLASVSQKVDSIKLVMQDNVDMALQNCVKLESIEKAAGECFFLFYFFSFSIKLLRRGASTTSWCLQKISSRLEKEDVVEEYEGQDCSHHFSDLLFI